MLALPRKAEAPTIISSLLNWLDFLHFFAFEEARRTGFSVPSDFKSRTGERLPELL